jgi:hypothetical protein
MAQIRSTYLHRVPYSLLWNNIVFEKKNPWSKIINCIFSKNLLNSFINYSWLLAKKNWIWSDNFFRYTSLYKNDLNIITPTLEKRINKQINLSTNSILKNSNNGTNESILGKTNFFTLNDNLYCLNAYYLQNFSNIKSRKKSNNKKINLKKKYKFNAKGREVLYKIKHKHTHKKKNINLYWKFKFGKFIQNNFEINLIKNYKIVNKNIINLNSNHNKYFLNNYTNYYIKLFLYNFLHYKELNLDFYNVNVKISDIIKEKVNKKFKKNSNAESKTNNNNDNNNNNNDDNNNNNNDNNNNNNDNDNKDNPKSNKNQKNKKKISKTKNAEKVTPIEEITTSQEATIKKPDNDIEYATKKYENKVINDTNLLNYEKNGKDAEIEELKICKSSKSQTNKKQKDHQKVETYESFLRDSLGIGLDADNIKKKSKKKELHKDEIIKILRDNIQESLKYILREVIDEDEDLIIDELLTGNPNKKIRQLLTQNKIVNFKYILSEALFENKEDNPLYQTSESISPENYIENKTKEDVDPQSQPISLNINENDIHTKKRSKIINLNNIENDIYFKKFPNNSQNLKNSDKKDESSYEVDPQHFRNYDDEFNYNYINIRTRKADHPFEEWNHNKKQAAEGNYYFPRINKVDDDEEEERLRYEEKKAKKIMAEKLKNEEKQNKKYMIEKLKKLF